MSSHYAAEVESTTSVQDELAGSDSTNLYSIIDRNNVHGLNLDVPENAQAIIKAWNEREDTTKFADSAVDDQLVIHVPFVSNVRVRSVLLKLGRGERTPRQLRIYTNQPNIVDFSDAEDMTPQLNISLQEGEVGVVEYPLRAAAFTNVHSLSLHFGDAVGAEISRIYYLGFKGDSRSVQKEVTSKLEIPAANAPDSLINKLLEKSKSQQSTAR